MLQFDVVENVVVVGDKQIYKHKLRDTWNCSNLQLTTTSYCHSHPLEMSEKTWIAFEWAFSEGREGARHVISGTVVVVVRYIFICMRKSTHWIVVLSHYFQKCPLLFSSVFPRRIGTDALLFNRFIIHFIWNENWSLRI